MIKKTFYHKKTQTFFTLNWSSIKIINIIEDFNLPHFFVKNKNIFKKILINE